VYVNVCGFPTQLFAFGVTVTVADCAVVPVFLLIKLAIFPVPEAAKPIVVLVFVQSKTVVATVPLKFTAVEIAALQITWSVGFETVGVELIV